MGAIILGFLSRYWSYLAVAVLLAGIVGVGYFYYKDTQHTIQILTQENANLKTEVQLQKQAIESLQNDIKLSAEVLKQTYSEMDIARQEAALLAKKLQEHDLGFLASQHPELVQSLINNGTAEALRCFEILSGSPLTAAEKAATKPSQINEACPTLANPNYHPTK